MRAALVLALLAVSAYVAAAAVPLTCAPAPFGYVCTGFTGRLYGWEPGGYGSECVVNGTLLLPVQPSKLYTWSGVEDTHIVWSRSPYTGVVLHIHGRTLVAFGGGRLFYSGALLGSDINVSNGVLHAKWMKYTVLFAQTPDTVVTIVYSNGTTVMEGIAGFLGVSESCIVWFDEPRGPWTGGLVDSPACVKGEPVKRLVYNGMPVVVAVRRFETRYGVLGYILFARQSVDALAEVNILVEAEVPRGLHIVKGERRLHYYVAEGWWPPEPLPEYDAVDATAVVNGTRLCTIPAGARILYELLWDPAGAEPGVIRRLAPGELIVYEYRGRVYACLGDMEWLDAAPPSIVQPRYREFGGEIVVEGNPVAMVVSCDGSVYYGRTLRIPLGYALSHTLWVVTHTHAFRLYVTARPLLASPEVMAAAFIIFLVALILTRRPQKPPDVVHVEWDLPRDPEPPSLASDPSDAALRHVDAWGYCPDAVELAQRYKVLAKPGAVLCPLDVEPSVEEALRALGRFAAETLWALRRDSRYTAVLYAPLGGSVLYWHVYCARPGARPEEVVWDALMEASRQRPPPGSHTVRLGVLILAVDDAEAERLGKVVERLRTGGSWNVSGYLAAVVKSPGKLAQTLHDWTNKNVREIVVASPGTLWRVVSATCPYIRGVNRPGSLHG